MVTHDCTLQTSGGISNQIRTPVTHVPKTFQTHAEQLQQHTNEIRGTSKHFQTRSSHVKIHASIPKHGSYKVDRHTQITDRHAESRALAAAKKAKASPKGKMWAKAVRNATASSSDLGSSGSALPLAGARPNLSMIDLDEDAPAGLPTVDSQARSISKLHITMAYCEAAAGLGGTQWKKRQYCGLECMQAGPKAPPPPAHRCYSCGKDLRVQAGHTGLLFHHEHIFLYGVP